jgi:hypothetical protein
MSSATEDATYQFSEGFDRIFLEQLYGGDNRIAEEIFRSSLSQVERSLLKAESLVREGDIKTLGRIFHHFKPLFGYIGQLNVQDSVQQFEDLCMRTDSEEEVLKGFMNISRIIKESMNLLQKEILKLNEYNNQRA